MAMTASFESALQGRVGAMIDACTRCGKCVEVCPAAEPAGLSAEQRQNPAEVIGGVIDLLRGSAGRRANGRAAASSRANASRRAITASIRVFCSA
jgi:heterodisulfide reductase subunit D